MYNGDIGFIIAHTYYNALNEKIDLYNIAHYLKFANTQFMTLEITLVSFEH